MDNETRQMFELVLKKLDGVENRLGGMENRLGGMENRLGGMENRLGGVENRLGGVENRLGGVENRLDGMEKRQEEMYLIMRSLEENSKVTRSEQDKLIYTVSDIQARLAKVTDKVGEHDRIIEQIKAIG